ncbi:hypothetical protein ACE1B6_06875 [Aerosakkonemataceae cyanobacterium BLCC-F154]|uniref:Uncharacterized protein n=1 Tax=Floridaenema fluviatile BLCC-F154 TaxID=3153640 RepID=A0ABV4Y847_9CYAN
MANRLHGCGFSWCLATWLQWKKHQARWNAIDREIYHSIAKGIAHTNSP